MAFPAEQCPNCDAPVSGQADYCSACGAPSASAFSTCPRCRAAVGNDSAFCWQCGLKQEAETRRTFYDQRWRRSPTDFALRVDLSAPKEGFVHGLQVDDGTLALVFQNGCYNGLLEPGYYPHNALWQHLPGADAGKEMHAVLLDSQGAEVDFALEALRTQGQAPVDIRLRLIFQVVDPKLFVTEFVKAAPTLATADLARAFMGDVRAIVQTLLADCALDKLVGEFRIRELMEGEILAQLQPLLERCGLEATAVRLAELGGPTVDTLREKLGQVDRLNYELEIDRRLRDALRREKVEAFRDEQSLQDYLAQIQHETGFADARREEERQTHFQEREHRFHLKGIHQDYERRRAEIFNRLDEQKLQHKQQLAECKKDLQARRLVFDADLAEQATRFEAGQQQQLAQGRTAEQLAESGLGLFEKTQRVKHEAVRRDAFLRLEIEERQLQLRGSASMQALLSTFGGEHADRLLRLAELEMLKGRTVEQSMAIVSSHARGIHVAEGDTRIDSTTLNQTVHASSGPAAPSARSSPMLPP
jgi:hypothetical protein